MKFMSRITCGCWLGGNFSAEKAPGKVKEKRLSASSMGLSEPLYVVQGSKGQSQNGLWSQGTCQEEFQVEPMGRAEDAAVSVCGVQESP